MKLPKRPLTSTPYGRKRGRQDNRPVDPNYVHNVHIPRPSQQFDWDIALYVHAHTMKELGYPLSAQQKEMLKDG